MKTIGLIGGTGWISTLEYYRVINQITNVQLGGMYSAKLLLYSVNHEEFKLSPGMDWAEVSRKLIVIAQTLEQAGADCLLICANTMHRVAGTVQDSIKIPLIHIAVETGKEIKNKKLKRVGLLGTRISMEEPFLKDILSESGIDTIIPEAEDRDFIQTSIFTELGKGIFRQETKESYQAIIKRLMSRGAEGIILGCTEIPLLIKQEDVQIPVFDSTTIHARAAVEFSLSNDKK